MQIFQPSSFNDIGHRTLHGQDRVLRTLENLENVEKSPQKYFFSQKKVFIHKDFSHFRQGNLKIFSNHGG